MRSQSIRSQSIRSQSIRSCLRSHPPLSPYHPSLQPHYAALPEPLASLASGGSSHLLQQPAAVATAAPSMAPGTASAMSATLLEPATYKEAMASEEAEQWQQALDEEIAPLMANGAWTPEQLPPGLQAIPSQVGLQGEDSSQRHS